MASHIFNVKFWVGDWKVRLAALMAAVVLWAWVRSDQTLTLTVSAPLEIRAASRTMRFVHRPPSSVEVKLLVRRDSLPAVTPKSVRVVANLSGLRGRRVSVPLTDDDVLRPDGVTVLDITPSLLVLEFEPVGGDGEE
jgi:hypothetical protein